MRSPFAIDGRVLTLFLAAAMVALLAGGGCATTCGKCGQATCLPNTCLQEVDRPVLIDFHSPQCPGCQEIESGINMLAMEYDGEAVVEKVHVYQYPHIAEAHHVRTLPTVVLYVRGREAARWVEPRPTSVYRGAIEKALRAMNVPENNPARADENEWSSIAPSSCVGEACALGPADR
jgi:thioredoxin-like negative regulator of GroEL